MTKTKTRRVVHPSRFCLGGRPPAFDYRNSELHCEQTPVSQLASKFGTPLYLYSQNTIRERYVTFDTAFRSVPHNICYSVKANSNLSLLKLLATLGCGFDVVSGGELQRVLKAVAPPFRPVLAKGGGVLNVVFSGVGKTADELDLALKSDILLFNVESEQEMQQLGERAAVLKREARVALRVNPDVAADTHPYISTGLHKHKFGVPMQVARAIYAAAACHPWLDVAGISVHIGSQITEVKPFGEAMQRVAGLVRDLRADGHNIRYVDAGGGLGINYDNSDLAAFPQRAKNYAKVITRALRVLDLHLLLEPGRSIVGPAGALITRVLYRKQNDGKRFIVVDAAMNDLIRPTLYGAYHEIVPVAVPPAGSRKPKAVDVVGPICETGDFFARDRELPEVREGDLLAILDAGAYGMSISSNYNTRPRAAEVLVDGRKARLIRKRETFEDLIRSEV